MLASGFSAILAYVLTLLAGKGGLNGWSCKSWPRSIVSPANHQLGIFLIEGAITVVICIVGWFLIIDFPAKASKFLQPEEQAFVISRLNADRQDAEEDDINLAVILHHLKDWRLYVWAFNLMASTLPGYAYSYFLPIILREGMGFSTTKSQLLTAPPYAFAAIVAFISGWLGDRYKIRGPIIAVHQLLTATGMLITTFAKGNAARYFGAYLGELMLCVLAYDRDLIVRDRHWLPAILRAWGPRFPSKQYYQTFEASCRQWHLHHRRRIRRYNCWSCFRGEREAPLSSKVPLEIMRATATDNMTDRHLDNIGHFDCEHHLHYHYGHSSLALQQESQSRSPQERRN